MEIIGLANNQQHLVLLVCIILNLIVGHRAEQEVPGPKQEGHCAHGNPTDFYTLFGTKTTYQDATDMLNFKFEVHEAKQHLTAFSDFTLNIEDHWNDSEQDSEEGDDQGTCQAAGSSKPVMLWFFSRHAIRYPAPKTIPKYQKHIPEIQQRILDAAKSGKSKLCEQDLAALRQWTILPMDAKKQGNVISKSGHHEMAAIGKRFYKLLPGLLNPKVSQLTVNFTGKVRTRQTASAFLSGFMKDNKLRDSLIKSGDSGLADKFTLADFHHECDKILFETGGSEKPKPQLLLDFMNGPLITKMVSDINDRLGLDQNPLTFKEIHMLNRMCHYDNAIRPDKDPARRAWCGIFTPENHKLIEFLDDLEDFYEDSYGTEVNSQTPCVAFEDLFQKIHSYLNTTSTKSKRNHQAHLYFSHAGAIKRIITSLGLYSKDFHDAGIYTRQARGHWTLDQIKKSLFTRSWRSSLLAPFSANIAFVLMRKTGGESDCGSDKSPQDQLSDYSVVTLLQEIPQKLPGCDADVFCPLEKFLAQYQPLVDSCDFYEICRHKTS